MTCVSVKSHTAWSCEQSWISVLMFEYKCYFVTRFYRSHFESYSNLVCWCLNANIAFWILTKTWNVAILDGLWHMTQSVLAGTSHTGLYYIVRQVSGWWGLQYDPGCQAVGHATAGPSHLPPVLPALPQCVGRHQTACGIHQVCGIYDTEVMREKRFVQWLCGGWFHLWGVSVVLNGVKCGEPLW